MPFYDYKCKDCGKVFEIEKGMNEKVHPKCPLCKSSKTARKFNVFRRGASRSSYLDHEGSEQSGSCSSCSSGVCSSCGTKGS
jgi:putative FmdB family regulatory protein